MVKAMNDELAQIVKWLQLNKISLNVRNTYFILFSSLKKRTVINDILEMN